MQLRSSVVGARAAWSSTEAPHPRQHRRRVWLMCRRTYLSCSCIASLSSQLACVMLARQVLSAPSLPAAHMQQAAEPGSFKGGFPRQLLPKALYSDAPHGGRSSQQPSLVPASVHVINICTAARMTRRTSGRQIDWMLFYGFWWSIAGWCTKIRSIIAFENTALHDGRRTSP